MGYEVDLFPGGRGGAAIVVRWGAPGNYRLLVYDGGTPAAAEQLVRHVREHCLTSHVDHVVSPAPPPKACRRPRGGSGPAQRRRAVDASALGAHRSLVRSPTAARQLEDSRWRERSRCTSRSRARSSGPSRCCRRSRSWYVEGLLPAFEAALPPATGLTLADAARWVRLASAAVGSRWDVETLPRDPATSAEDESSVVLYGEFEGRGVLLTSNAGVRALSDACTFAEYLGLGLPSNLRLMQVPNDGKSRPSLEPRAGPPGGRAPAARSTALHRRRPSCLRPAMHRPWATRSWPTR